MVIGITLIICIFTLISILNSRPSYRQFSMAQNNSSHSSLPKNIFESDFRPYAFYLSNISQRNIFQPFTQALAQPTQVDVAPAVSSVQGGLQKTLMVVGIMFGQVKEVVLKDVEQNETLLLHVGDKVRGATVEEIKQNQVILTDTNGQKIQLDY